MIARVWRGLVRTEKAAEYADIVERTGVDGYRRTPGNLGAQLLTRDLGGGRTELLTLSWWSTLDDIRAFAGDDVERARYYPEDDEYLLERDDTVGHFDVLPRTGADGFVFTRVLAAERPRVYASFTEPDGFSRWFVVPGFTTPVERLELDPRTGGSIRGVMVAQDAGTEVAFTARYGRVEAPHLVEFRFDDPPELVRLTIHDLGEDGTQITYENHGSPSAGRAEAIAAAEAMFDALS